jgi:hypothetical protein
MRKQVSNKFRAVVSLLIGLIVLGYSSRDLTAQQHSPSECEDLRKLIKKQEATRIQDQKALNNCLAHQGSCSQFLIDDLNNAIALLDQEIVSLLMDYTNCNVLQNTERSNWIQLAPEGPSPAKRWQHKCMYNATNNRMIMFGGKIPSTDFADDVWVLQHANGLDGTPAWIQLRPERRGPMGRHMPTAVYDQTNNRMVVFGGHTNDGPCPSIFAADVWVLRNANGLGGAPAWVHLEPTGRPPSAREWHTAVYDAASNGMVVFGGTSCSGDLNDVWILRNANGLGGAPAWVHLEPTGEPPFMRVGHTAIYDAANNRMMVFGGGLGFGNPFFNDVWVLEHANGLGGNPAWVQLNPTGMPPSVREDHTAIYDVAKNQMIVFGGWRREGLNQLYFNEVWILKNANGLGGTPAWIQHFPTGAPPSARELATAVYDPASNRMIIFAGSYSPNDPPNCGSGACTNDVWVLTHVP